MRAVEALEPDALEAGAFERDLDEIMALRRGNGVAGSAAEPNWHFEKTSTRLIGFVSFAQAVLVDTAKKKSTDPNGPVLASIAPRMPLRFEPPEKPAKASGHLAD